MRPDDVLAAIAADIERVKVDSRWTFFDGYQPRGANPDRVAGIEARDQFGRDEERERDPDCPDIGVGDLRSRKAFQDTAWLCTFLDLRLAASLQALGELPSRFVVVRRDSSLAVREEALKLSAFRVDVIAHCWDLADRAQQKAARIQLADPRISPPSARSAADQAVRILSRALSRGSTLGVATAEKLCDICRLRPQGPHQAPRCTTCHMWRIRNPDRGERPAKWDAEELAAPYAAAARRRARGEGFGAS